MILSDAQIRGANSEGSISIDPFEDSQLQSASYDLRVGAQGATTSSKKIVDIQHDGYLLMKPGDFAIVTSHEILNFDNCHVGRIGLRSKYARKGITATTGLQIDPGFRGRLTVGLYNLSPKQITLPFKDDLLSIEIHRLEEPCRKVYSGPFQGKLELGPSDIEAVVENDSMTHSEMLTMLSSLSRNVGELSNDVKTMKWIIPIIVSFGIGVIAILVKFS